MEENLQLLQHQSDVIKNDLTTGLNKLNDRITGMGKLMVDQHTKALDAIVAHKIGGDTMNFTYPIMSDTIGNLMGSLAAAQADMAIAQATGGSHHKKPFAQFKDLKAVADPVLGKNGLAVVQLLLNDGEGNFILQTVLGHKSNEWLSSRVLIKPAGMDHQKIGAAISYMRRYAYGAIICIGVDQDGEDPDYNAGR